MLRYERHERARAARACPAAPGVVYPGPMRVLVSLGVLVLVGCEGTLSTVSGMGADLDAASVATDAATSVSPDAFVTPYGGCMSGPPLDAPIAGCRPTPMPSTGDPAEDCVRRINQFRCECQHLPPLMRWRDGETCANQMAQYDSEHPDRAHAGFLDGICGGGSAQNECPGWGSIEQSVSGCLQQMWDEGPGDFYGPPPHGHYINMSSTSHSMVACGFHEGPRGVYATQNFR